MESDSELCRLCLVPVDPAAVVILNQAEKMIEAIQQITSIQVRISHVNIVIVIIISLTTVTSWYNTLYRLLNLLEIVDIIFLSGDY